MTTTALAHLRSAIDELHPADAAQLATTVEQLLDPTTPTSVHHVAAPQRAVLVALVDELRGRVDDAAVLRVASAGWDGLD